VILDPRKVSHTTATHQDDGVFQEVVTFAGYIDSGFFTVRKPYPGNLAQGGIRLLRVHHLYLQTYSSLLGTALQERSLALLFEFLSTLAH